jgi:hypothetical protein
VEPLLHQFSAGRRGSAAAQGQTGVTTRRRVDSWQQLIESIDSRKPKNVIAALRKRNQRLTESWKSPPRRSALAWLLIYNDCPIKDIAALLRPRKQKPGKGGNPGGLYRRLKPHYLAALIVEKYPHAERTDGLISTVIRLINDDLCMYGKTPLDPRPGSDDHLRIRTLLH